MTPELFIKQTQVHAQDVSRLMNCVAAQIQRQGKKHDKTKYKLVDEYVEYLNAKEKKVNPSNLPHAWEEHFRLERHHYQNQMHDDTNLFDVIEAFCDWCSASKQRTGKLLDPTKTRLPIVDFDLLFRNTLKWIVEHY